MISFLSKKLADFVVKYDETADHDIISYGFELFLMQNLSFFAILVASIPLGVFPSAVFAIAIFSTCRYFFGGAHAQTRVICFLSYSTLLFTGIYISRLVTIPLWAATMMFVFSMILILKYAPAGTEQVPVRKNSGKIKIGGILFVTAGYLFFCAFPSLRAPIGSMLVILPFFAALVIHPLAYRLYRCPMPDYTAG